MQKDDYKSAEQAANYHFKRFSRGLAIVDQDENYLIKNWLSGEQMGKRIYLDLGTGTGRIVRLLLTLTPHRIYALDQSSSMLDYFQKIFKNELEKKIAQTIHASSTRIPLKDSSVDLITSIHLFKHLKDIQPTLREIKRVLKKNGLLIFDILNANSLVKYNLGSCSTLSESTLKSILISNGFAIKEVAYLHIFGETIYNLTIFPSKMVHLLDQKITKLGIKLGTKIFVLAQRK